MKETFLCAKYSYKDDIAVKQKEAFEDGQKDGIIKGRIEGKIEGAQQKAKENARSYYANGIPIEIIAKAQNITIEQAKELIFND